MPRLQQRLNEFKRSFESGAPPYNTSREAVEIMHRATAVGWSPGLRQTVKTVDRVKELGRGRPSAQRL